MYIFLVTQTPRTDNVQAAQAVYNAVSSSGPKVYCVFCQRSGHTVADCEALKGKQSSKQPKRMRFIKNILLTPLKKSSVLGKSFKPITSQKFVSWSRQVMDQHVVTILRNMCGSKSFILFNALPLGKDSALW